MKLDNIFYNLRELKLSFVHIFKLLIIFLFTNQFFKKKPSENIAFLKVLKSQIFAYYITSTTKALASPPPMQRVARP